MPVLLSSGALKEVSHVTWNSSRGVDWITLEGGVVLGLSEQKEKGKDSKEKETRQAGVGEADGRLGQLI